MSELIKITYPINDSMHSNSSLSEFLYFILDSDSHEQSFIQWASSDKEYYGTDFIHLKKLQNDTIRIAFPEFYDDWNKEKNCMFMARENFIKFLIDWEVFRKSGKKYMMLREEDGWISLEDVKGDENE